MAPAAALRSLAPFFCLYITFGATLGFLSSAAPLILRARGVELAQIGLLQLINLPIGLTFLWASVVDRVTLPGLPHRIGWIGLMQAATVGFLAILSLGERWPLVALLMLAVASSVCVATMDVALEALVVETVPGERRPVVTSAKFCGASLGGILGAGVVVKYYDLLGWRIAILAIAGLAAISILPMLRYPERRLRQPPAELQARRGSMFEHLRAFAPLIAVLGFYFAAMFALTGFNNLALLDLGVPLSEVGFVNGSLAPIINLVMALLSGALVRRVGMVPLITVSAVGAVAAGCLMVAATASGAAWMAIAATVFGMICGGGLGVPVFSMIYRWAQGPRAATDYALLFGAAFFAAMPLRVGAPALAGHLGWPAYFALAVLIYVAAFTLLRGAIQRTIAVDQAASTGCTDLGELARAPAGPLPARGER